MPIPIGNSAPQTPRLDFLAEYCDQTWFRDARMVHPDEHQTTGIWLAHEPFHIRHGFINPDLEPLPIDGPAFPGYDVRVYVTRKEGPDLDDGAFPMTRHFDSTPTIS